MNLKRRDIGLAVGLGLIVSGSVTALGSRVGGYAPRKDCVPTASDCPSALAACIGQSLGDPCNYCENPAVSYNCVSGSGICALRLTNDGCGREMVGICGPIMCEGTPTGNYCPRNDCAIPPTLAE